MLIFFRINVLSIKVLSNFKLQVYIDNRNFALSVCAFDIQC